mmetsp:Transcript_10612/g.28820  ORF Transcript_10612/g.28820 Transcript_10612/m.28820 type:complete len:389 (-) Transcript_10612:143-1309(-)
MAAGAQKEQFAAFGFLQYMAAVHIFVHHLWQQTKYLDKRLYRAWGPGWVACFFVLSGFKLTYSQLKKKDPSTIDPLVPYMWRRWLRLCPLFYISLFMTLLLSVLTEEPSPLWIVLPFNLTLTFTWFGSVAGGWHAGWHGAHWYMADLLFHQLLWRWTYPIVRRLPKLACFLLMVACTCLTVLRCFMIRWKWAEQETTYWPVYTFNQFVCGMCLAQLYVSRPKPPEGTPADRFALIVGERRVPMSGLASVISLAVVLYETHPRAVYAFFPNGVWSGVLLPLFIPMVWCLCLDEGPLDWLCQRRPFIWMGEVSYGVYIFHWNALMILKRYDEHLLPMRWSEDARFYLVILPVTTLFAAVMQFCVDRPIQAWGSRLLKSAAAPRDAHVKVA